MVSLGFKGSNARFRGIMRIRDEAVLSRVGAVRVRM